MRCRIVSSAAMHADTTKVKSRSGICCSWSGHDWDLNLRATNHPEFDAWRWNDYWGPAGRGGRVQTRRLRNGADRTGAISATTRPPQPLPAQQCMRAREMPITRTSRHDVSEPTSSNYRQAAASNPDPHDQLANGCSPLRTNHPSALPSLAASRPVSPWVRWAAALAFAQTVDPVVQRRCGPEGKRRRHRRPAFALRTSWCRSTSTALHGSLPAIGIDPATVQADRQGPRAALCDGGAQPTRMAVAS